MRAVRIFLSFLGWVPRTALCLSTRKVEMAQRESKLSRKIIDAISAAGGFAFKVHGGPMMMAGLPDIVACIGGRFVCIETKMPDGKNPSVIQQFVHEKIRKAGGEVHVARSVQQAIDLLGL